MYKKKPKRRHFPRVVWAGNKYAKNMPQYKSRDQTRRTQPVRIYHPLYFPCRCLCFGFLELKERIMLAGCNRRRKTLEEIQDLPDNINAILASDGLKQLVSTQTTQFPALFKLPCSHHTDA